MINQIPMITANAVKVRCGQHRVTRPAANARMPLAIFQPRRVGSTIGVGGEELDESPDHPEQSDQKRDGGHRFVGATEEEDPDDHREETEERQQPPRSPLSSWSAMAVIIRNSPATNSQIPSRIATA